MTNKYSQVFEREIGSQHSFRSNHWMREKRSTSYSSPTDPESVFKRSRTPLGWRSHNCDKSAPKRAANIFTNQHGAKRKNAHNTGAQSGNMPRSLWRSLGRRRVTMSHSTRLYSVITRGTRFWALGTKTHSGVSPLRQIQYSVHVTSFEIEDAPRSRRFRRRIQSGCPSTH